MKKNLLVLSATLLMAFTATFANENKPIPDAVVKEVQQQFAGATTVQWKATDNYYKASVALNDVYLDVFYNLDGSLIGVSRNISVHQLPLLLRKDVAAMKTAYYVSDLFELVSESGTEYFITYKNGTETKVYRGTAAGWTRY